jgi:hypothetical protein
VSVLLGNGDDTFRAAQNSFGAGTAPVSVAAGDFNGGGKPDLAVADSAASGTVSVLLGNGDGTFQRGHAYTTGSNAESVVVGDFNSDGKFDLAVARITYKGGDGNDVAIVLFVAPPRVSISGPTDGVHGQPRTFTFTAADPNPADHAGTFTYTINWGDGSPLQSLSGSAQVQATHVFVESGAYPVSVTAADKDGLTSNPASQSIAITAYAVQIDPIDGKRELVGGGGHGTEVEIENDGRGSGMLQIEIEDRHTEHPELNVAVAGPVDRIVLYGQKSDVARRLRPDRRRRRCRGRFRRGHSTL